MLQYVAMILQTHLNALLKANGFCGHEGSRVTNFNILNIRQRPTPQALDKVRCPLQLWHLRNISKPVSILSILFCLSLPKPTSLFEKIDQAFFKRKFMKNELKCHQWLIWFELYNDNGFLTKQGSWFFYKLRAGNGDMRNQATFLALLKMMMRSYLDPLGASYCYLAGFREWSPFS